MRARAAATCALAAAICALATAAARASETACALACALARASASALARKSASICACTPVRIVAAAIPDAVDLNNEVDVVHALFRARMCTGDFRDVLNAAIELARKRHRARP